MSLLFPTPLSLDQERSRFYFLISRGSLTTLALFLFPRGPGSYLPSFLYTAGAFISTNARFPYLTPLVHIPAPILLHAPKSPPQVHSAANPESPEFAAWRAPHLGIGRRGREKSRSPSPPSQSHLRAIQSSAPLPSVLALWTQISLEGGKLGRQERGKDSGLSADHGAGRYSPKSGHPTYLQQQQEHGEAAAQRAHGGPCGCRAKAGAGRGRVGPGRAKLEASWISELTGAVEAPEATELGSAAAAR